MPRRATTFLCLLAAGLVLAPVTVARGVAVINPWNLDRINQRALPLDGNASMGSLTGAGIDIYLADTGVRPTHEQLNGRVLPGIDIPTRDGTARVNPPASDCDGHGTHVASTAAGTTTGVATAARIISVRVLDCNGDGEVEEVVEAMEWIRAHHQSGRTAVANLSLGVDLGDDGTSIIEMVRALVADGVIVVVAAGNGDGSGKGIDACRIAPGSDPLSLTVGAVTKTDQIASYSNWGPCVDIWAPGGDRTAAVNAAWYRSDTDYMGDLGTSMAAPHVSGLLALLAEQQPSLCPQQYVDAVLQRATTGAVVGLDATSNNRLLFADTSPIAGAATPGRPSNIVVTPDAGSVLVGWDAPCDGGTAVTAYRVSVLYGGRVVKSVTVDGTKRAARVRGLVNGRSYQVVVKPRNAAGAGIATKRLGTASVGALHRGFPRAISKLVRTDTGTSVSVKSLTRSRCKVSNGRLVAVSAGSCRISIRPKDTQTDIIRTITVAG